MYFLSDHREPLKVVSYASRERLCSIQKILLIKPNKQQQGKKALNKASLPMFFHLL